MEAAGEESVVKKAACRVQEGKSPTFCELQVLRTRLLVRDMETKHFYAREKTAVLYVAKKASSAAFPHGSSPCQHDLLMVHGKFL
jgi:hypothetical protein